MSIQKPLFWQQGILLQPQHFQLLEHSFQGMLSMLQRYKIPDFWGVGDLEIQKSSLEVKKFELQAGTFLFPDGTCVVYPGNAIIESRSFQESWAEPLNVYLGLRKWNDAGINVTVVEDLRSISKVTTRFAATPNPEEIEDLHAGGRVGRVKRLHYVLKLLWEDELKQAEDYLIIPIAQLLKFGAEVRLADDYIPPCLTIAGSKSLFKLIGEIRDQITARSFQLEESKEERGIHSAEFGSRDMVYLLALRSLNRYVPLFHHFTENRQFHPTIVYSAIRQLIGELSSFSERVNAIGDLKNGKRIMLPYDHHNLWGCFSAAQDLVSQLLDEITAGPEYVIRLVHDGVYYGTELKPSIFQGTNRFYLAIRTGDNADTVMQSVKTVVKLGSREDLQNVVARALPGIGLDHQVLPPQQLPRRANTMYFQINHNNELWEYVAKHCNIALFWKNAPEDLEVELMVVGRT
jgi:type VI secretion system protein ImpJ